MSEHHATVAWERGTADFTYDVYSRNHEWAFDGETRVAASAAPDFLGEPDRVDPEQAFVAAISSCHMLTFLAIAARKRHTVDSYRDAAVGYLEKNAEGKLAVTRVLLRPRIVWADDAPAREDLDRIHELAHENCFIANSVRTEIRVEHADD
jgi:organic hydroperoxide reductase OsmC/OhrA